MTHELWFRLLEILLYTALNSLPYHLCALYVFARQRRFSLPVTILCLLPATALELALNLLVGLGVTGNTALLNFIWAVGYFVSYCIVIREPIGKVGFVVLVMLNLNNFNIVVSKYLESLLFPSLAMERYHLGNCLTMVISLLLIMLPHGITLRRRYVPAMQRTGNSFLWRYLWLIPSIFYFLWYYHIHFDSSSSLEVATDPHSLFFLTVISCGSYLIYYIVLRLVNESANNAELRSHNQQLALQTLQYENLQERINETRKANHDLRHHITVMQGHLESGDYGKLKSYFGILKASVPTGTVSFCQHPTLNMLLVYFAQQALENNIQFQAKLALPATLPIPDSDLAVLVGNLVENAVEACALVTESERRVTVRGMTREDRLLLTIDNTFACPPRKDVSGVYLSSKHSGQGIGIESAKAIARRHGGEVRIEQQEDLFCVSIILSL